MEQALPACYPPHAVRGPWAPPDRDGGHCDAGVPHPEDARLLGQRLHALRPHQPVAAHLGRQGGKAQGDGGWEARGARQPWEPRVPGNPECRSLPVRQVACWLGWQLARRPPTSAPTPPRAQTKAALRGGSLAASRLTAVQPDASSSGCTHLVVTGALVKVLGIRVRPVADILAVSQQVGAWQGRDRTQAACQSVS